MTGDDKINNEGGPPGSIEHNEGVLNDSDASDQLHSPGHTGTAKQKRREIEAWYQQRKAAAATEQLGTMSMTKLTEEEEDEDVPSSRQTNQDHDASFNHRTLLMEHVPSSPARERKDPPEGWEKTVPPEPEQPPLQHDDAEQKSNGNIGNSSRLDRFEASWVPSDTSFSSLEQREQEEKQQADAEKTRATPTTPTTKSRKRISGGSTENNNSSGASNSLQACMNLALSPAKAIAGKVVRSIEGFQGGSGRGNMGARPLHRRTSSLDLRKMPTSILLKPPGSEAEKMSIIDDSRDDDFLEMDDVLDGLHPVSNPLMADNPVIGSDAARSCLYRTCLSRKYKLRTQLMLSFGIVNLVTVIFVVFGCIALVYLVGENVKTINQKAFENQLVDDIQPTTVRYLAEALEQQFMPIDLIDILQEAAQDRFQGYPFIEDDANVPFWDIESDQNVYPIVGPAMSLDWQIKSNVQEGNHQEHIQNARWESFYQSQPAVSTAQAVFIIQGACDPNEQNTSGHTYWDNCTAVNNDITQGGALHPVPTASVIYRKGADLTPLLKAMFEVKEEVRDLGLYFASMGAGAVMNFPAYPMNTQASYTSIGCDWMNAVNPIDPTKGPIGRPEEIQRCHKIGTKVSNREYNPLERGWCREQALNPQKTFLDSYVDAWTPGHWLLSIGRAIYDRQTKQFVACSYIGISLSLIQKKLEESLVTENSELTVIRFDPKGTVISSTAASVFLGYNDTDVKNVDQAKVGFTEASYKKLYELVEFGRDDVAWDPKTVRRKYEEFWILEDGYLVAVSPMPRIPDTYDPDYKPEFFVVLSTSTDDVYRGVDVLNVDVESQVFSVVVFSIVAGAIGLIATTLIIICMSHTLSSPLHDINIAANDIVKSFGDNPVDSAQIDEDADENDGLGNHDQFGSKTKEESHPQESTSEKGTKAIGFKWWAPRTELSDVLDEFNRMVESFSGSLLAKSDRGKRVEVANKFEMRKEFAELYRSRKDPNFDYSLEVDDPKDSSEFGEDITSNHFYEFGFLHLGSNVQNESLPDGGDKPEVSDGRRQFASRLFLWTVGLIATPLLLTTVTISGVVSYITLDAFDQSVDDAQAFFIGVKLDALSVHANLRAELVASLSAVPIRDGYFLARYFGWLLFGGVARANSYTDMLNGVDDCKMYSNIDDCPYYQSAYTCDCSWNDRASNISTCQEFSESQRHRQRASFSVESSDALFDGDRVFTSFPRVATSPETTEWWADAKKVPGWLEGFNATGHDTLYGRLRTASAMPLFPVLYNYDRKKTNYLAQYVAFEADGLMLGYGGCTPGNMENYAWHSTEENLASTIRPDLCPLGKYGYDPRCRDWYDKGRKLAIEKVSSLYISAPYSFAASKTAGQSVTIPLIDPLTGEHVGQVLNDFLSNSVFEALEAESTPLGEGGFPIIIAVQDENVKNTILGPGFTIGGDIKSISSVVLSGDEPEEKRRIFQDVVRSMNDGEPNAQIFQRTAPSGNTETVYIAHAPVRVRGIRPVDSSSFGSGVEVNEYLVYSLGLCETEEGLLKPFKEIEDDMRRQIMWTLIVLAVGIVISTSFVIYVSYLLTSSITEPMLDLLDLIRRMNRSDFDGEPPKIDQGRGSREIAKVSNTVLILYKIVRAANDFFFAGELELAYLVLVDALRLFKRLGNKKAVAVASNNLGNTMLAMYREMAELGIERYGGLTRKQIISKGTRHFHEAISLGEKAYDEFYEAEGWTPNCLDFMQHLSNRYFNRALFLLMVKDDHEQPNEIIRLGIRDLEIARDMDMEIVEYGEDVGFNRENRAHKLFAVRMTRSRGHNMLLEMGYPEKIMTEKGYPQDWELGESLDESFKMLQAENLRGSSELFKDVNVLGRVQQLEVELIKYKMLIGDVQSAARVAIRMLHEDAYIFADAYSAAVDALLAYVDSTAWPASTRSRVNAKLVQLTSSLDEDLLFLDDETRVSTVKGSVAGGMSIDSFSEDLGSRLSRRSQDRDIATRRSSRMNWVKKEVSGGFVTMEDF